MRTREDLKLMYPKLDTENFEKLVALYNFHHFMENDKMRQSLAFKTLTNTLNNMYIYNDEKIVLKTLCERLVNDNVVLKIEDNNVILKNNDGRYILPKTAISYIKHLQFENSIKDYYIGKQKEKTETIYFDVSKYLEENKA